LILVTLVCLCWGGGYGVYRAGPPYYFVGGLLGVLGLILFIVLVVIFLLGEPPAAIRTR
jgi:hypothetical protein